MPLGTPARKRGDRVPAVERAVGILRAFADGRREASLTDLARHLGIHKSTAHGILATLAQHRFVERDPVTRRYRLGPALGSLARAAMDQDLGTLAHPHLVRLQKLSGETAALHVQDGEGSRILDSVESPRELRVTAPPGYRLPPFAGSVGKVLGAFAPHLPLPSRLPAYTPRSITEPTRYRRELKRIRRTGIAYDDMEYLPGVRAVSAPLFRGTPSGGADAVATLSIIGVGARLPIVALRRLAGPLRASAQTLSAALGADALQSKRAGDVSSVTRRHS